MKSSLALFVAAPMMASAAVTDRSEPPEVDAATAERAAKMLEKVKCRTVLRDVSEDDQSARFDRRPATPDTDGLLVAAVGYEIAGCNLLLIKGSGELRPVPHSDGRSFRRIPTQ